jgi:hypothetical protein
VREIAIAIVVLAGVVLLVAVFVVFDKERKNDLPDKKEKK